MSDYLDDLWQMAQSMSPEFSQAEVLYRAVEEIKAERKFYADSMQSMEQEQANLRHQLAEATRKLEEARTRNEGRDLYAWRYARLSEKNPLMVGVPYVVARNKQGELEHLYFGALGQACDILWPMPKQAIEQGKGGDDAG